MKKIMIAAALLAGFACLHADVDADMAVAEEEVAAEVLHSVNEEAAEAEATVRKAEMAVEAEATAAE